MDAKHDFIRGVHGGESREMGVEQSAHADFKVVMKGKRSIQEKSGQLGGITKLLFQPRLRERLC